MAQGNTHGPTKMTRAHFRLIARVISQQVSKKVREQLAVDFANALSITNPLFNRHKFINACIHGDLR